MGRYLLEPAMIPRRARKVLIAVAAVVVLAAAGVFLARRLHPGGGETGSVKRVAVLPFENLGAPEDDYFADGIADEIRGKLTALPGLQVIARGSSTPYKKTTKTPKQIAEELEVGYLLTATVRWEKSGGTSRVHVSPELIEVSGSGAPTSKWQQPFDAALTDVFQVQSDIATRVAQALGAALGAGEEKRLSEKPTQNVAAYDAFLQGEEISNRTGITDPVQPAQGARFLRAGRGARPPFRAGVGEGLDEPNRTCTPTARSDARAGGACPEGGRDGGRAGPEPPEGYLALGGYQRLVTNDLGRALEQYDEGTTPCAWQCGRSAGDGARAE